MKLKRDFFQRDTLKVAKDLLGKVIVRRTKGKIIKARVIETEAYCGLKDKACHARHGRTKRNEPMWGQAGITYIYLCMGLWDLLNIITKLEGEPEAVLIRRIVPLDNFNKNSKSYGPGKTTKYLQIDRSFNRLDLTTSDELWVEDDGFLVASDNILTAPRIGIDYAGNDKEKPWRFILKEF